MERVELSIADCLAGMADGRFSAVALCEAYLNRIAALDRAGPLLRAVIEVNPDALEIATARDQAREQDRRDGRSRGLLHGIPVLVKDNIDTGDTMMTSAGSLAMAGHRADRDAHLVKRLRDAGAVILGKTNLSEWAFFRSTRGCSGWSSRGGQVRNPYVLDRSPSGSSSGSAVAVAANLCAGAIGTETDGSVVSPAASNGIVGLKPTVGLVSRSGVIPISATQDTAGPMARSVADLATLLTVIAGPDRDDPASDPATGEPAPVVPDYRTFLDPDGLRGARLGVARAYFGGHEAVDRVANAALATLEARGATLIDPIDLGDPSRLRGPEMTLMLHEFKDGLDRYLKDHPNAPCANLAAIIAFNRANAKRVMPYFGQELLEMAAATDGIAAPSYLQAKRTCLRLSRQEGIDKALAEHRLDAIVAPTRATPPGVIDPLLGDKPPVDGRPSGCSGPAAMAGTPHITVPAGQVFGLPVGLSFFAGAYREDLLIRLAYGFEQATLARTPPSFLPSIGTKAQSPEQ